MVMTARPVLARTDARSGAMMLRIPVEVLAMVGLSTVLGLLMAPRWGTSPVDLLYLPPVLASAALYGLWPSLFASVASALAYNFFFTAPIHSFRIDRPSDLVTVAILFLVAVVTSQLAARMRSQARIAAANAARNATIAGLAGHLLSSSSEEEIGAVACAELASLFDCNAVMVGRGEPAIIASAPADAPLSPSDFATAAFVLEKGESAGRGASRATTAEWLFYPVRSRSEILVAIGLARDDGAPPVPSEHAALLANLLDQVALALDRVRSEAETRGVAGLRERDRLRGALLSSVGHDLRTPLTAIIAAAAELRHGPDEGSLTTIAGEAAKLDRYIANLLDMARIEAGAVKLRTEPTDLVDAVAAAVRDLRAALDDHPLEIAVPADLPLVMVDPHLLHHCLINILDNAARHSGPGTLIRVAARAKADGVLLEVADEGAGLAHPPEEVFETFARINGSDQSGGTGLGLAIVHGFAAAMGLEVSARNRDPEPGAAFSIRFPPPLTMTATGDGDAAPRA